MQANSRRIWLRLCAKILVLAAFFWLIFGFLFGLQRTDNVSMDPQIKAGDLLLFSRFEADFLADDAVVYRHDDKTLISRIIAVPGEVVTLDDEGYLLVDDVRIFDAPTVDPTEVNTIKISLPFRVPTGEYFLMDDNLDSFENSIEFGSVRREDILGKIISVIRTRSI